ncbi:MAG: twin-arginine translocase subunit TatB [Rhodobacteraceae bacterium]|nr:MAG: twin-arginine translocase subunit TatB [Paracoccaceae bacterium]
MFDIGWSELMVIGSLALIVVGPKELPRLLRTVGQYVAQARGMAREFQRSMEDAAREVDLSEMKELRETANELRSLQNMKVDYKTAAAKPGLKPAPKAASPAAKPATAPAAPAAASRPEAREGAEAAPAQASTDDKA